VSAFFRIFQTDRTQPFGWRLLAEPSQFRFDAVSPNSPSWPLLPYAQCAWCYTARVALQSAVIYSSDLWKRVSTMNLFGETQNRLCDPELFKKEISRIYHMKERSSEKKISFGYNTNVITRGCRTAIFSLINLFFFPFLLLFLSVFYYYLWKITNELTSIFTGNILKNNLLNIIINVYLNLNIFTKCKNLFDTRTELNLSIMFFNYKCLFTVGKYFLSTI